MKRSLHSVLIALVVITIFIITGAVAWTMMKNRPVEIRSFAECVAAGNPVMESYPRQCEANGQAFVEGVTNGSSSKDGSAVIDGATCKNMCGDGTCAEIVCLAVGCPCAETPQSCPADCH